jgi:hypothetical protein
MDSINFINQLFDRLDQWKEFPTYQLERRVDIFFAMYLPFILKKDLNFVTDKILPEFPVRYGDVHPEREELNKSYRIDYVAVDHTQRKVLLIELKTDQKSLRKEQIEYLEFAHKSGIEKLMLGFKQIKKYSNATKKYKAFEKELNDLQWNIPEIAASYSTSIVFIAPRNEGVIEKFRVITFEIIAGILEKTFDPVAHRFALSLRSWANDNPYK